MNPGGSQVPVSDDLTSEYRRYRRHGGDHVARYRWVARTVRNARVLDVGCGHGFGALILGTAARSYTGVDIDRPAVDWARRFVGPATPTSEFLDGPNLPDGAKFDAVVCFEVVEHVDDPAGLLRTLRDRIVPGGTIFLSTPNGSLSAGRPEWYMSPFHRTEFTAPEFGALVSSVLGEGGTFLAQRRSDSLDVLPAIVRARLAPSGAAAARGPGSADATPPAFRQVHELFRRLPSPYVLWRATPMAAPLRPGLGYSHLLWIGSPRTDGSPRA